MNFEELPPVPFCEYGVPNLSPLGAMDCGLDAFARVWWKEDESDAMYVCEEHLAFIMDSEEEDEDEQA